MTVLGIRIENEKKLMCIIECTACFIEERGDGYCVRLTTAHPTLQKSTGNIKGTSRKRRYRKEK